MIDRHLPRRLEWMKVLVAWRFSRRPNQSLAPHVSACCPLVLFSFRGATEGGEGGGGAAGGERRGGAAHCRDGTSHAGRPRQAGDHHRGVLRVQGIDSRFLEASLRVCVSLSFSVPIV